MRLAGVEYDINWRKFTPGKSIFIPCLNTREVEDQLVRFTRQYRLKVLTKVCIVDGIKGLRIWRLP